MKKSRSPAPSSDDTSTVLSEVLSAVTPVELSHEQRVRMRGRILSSVAPPPNTITVRGTEAEWREIWPRVWVQQLHLDAQSSVQTVIVRMEAGGVIPPHAHEHEEECLVLDGELRMGDFYVRRGDLHIARAGSKHGELSAPTGALLMIRTVVDRGRDT